MPGFRCILLTGAGGFVGRCMARALVAGAPEARRAALVHAAPAAPIDGFETVQADIADTAAVEAAVAALRPDLVLHLAAQSSVGAAAGGAAETWRVNAVGALSLAEALARHAPEATVLFTSSSEVYGAAFNDGPLDEDTPPRPQNAYARSKLAAEGALSDVLPPTARLVIARAFNHTGPGQDERFALPSFAAQIARIEAGLAPPRIMVGNLDAERDFLHVDDVVAAYLALVEAATRLPHRALVNVASGVPRRIGDLLDALVAQARVPLAIVQDPARMRPSDVPRATAAPERLRAWTGWGPASTMETMLADVLVSARTHGGGRDPRSGATA